MGETHFEAADDAFFEAVIERVRKARDRFPAPNPTIAALTEEVGELAQAALHMREGKHNDWWKIYDEAVDVAVMALRMATEGDGTIGAVPTAENAE